jgi:hypothetical protein
LTQKKRQFNNKMRVQEEIAKGKKMLFNRPNNNNLREEAISLEVLREIYARHLEALKIIDSGVGNEQADK